MAQEHIPVAANVLGTIGTIFWCIQLVPQIWHNWRHKKTDGLPPSMMMLWAICAVPFGVYMVLQGVNIPIQIQPQMFGFFALVNWGQILYYNHNYSRVKIVGLVAGTSALFGGIEALLILTLRIPYKKGTTWPVLLVGVIAAIALAAGLIPPYFELAKRGGRVIGINWFFLGMDTLGAVFSLFALVAQSTFDILGGILYICVILLEGGIFMSHVIWRFRHRQLLKDAKASGKPVDDLLENEAQDQREKPEGTQRSTGDIESQNELTEEPKQPGASDVQSAGSNNMTV